MELTTDLPNATLVKTNSLFFNIGLKKSSAVDKLVC
jgi:hypothetical protein